MMMMIPIYSLFFFLSNYCFVDFWCWSAASLILFFSLGSNESCIFLVHTFKNKDEFQLLEEEEEEEDGDGKRVIMSLINNNKKQTNIGH